MAGAGGAASLLIALVGFKSFSTITDGAMWAIAVMAAPAVMAVAFSKDGPRGNRPAGFDEKAAVVLTLKR
ncbi:MAG TPA: hypothetical protein VKA46_10070 [Gemmataceae bacterium]|nr:hypothetical protein [Gemmataceae bacterium]